MSDPPRDPEFPEEMHERFLFYAEADLQAGESMLTSRFWHEPCFLARESVEKSLKAFLQAAGQDVPDLHSLRTLCRQCAGVDKSFLRLAPRCNTLMSYETDIRYPPGSDYPFTRADAEEAVAFAREVFAAVRAKIDQRKQRGLL